MLIQKAINKLLRSLDFTTNQVMYAQEGEDHILRNHFKDKKDGFYVDIGAYHPKHLSNTAYLYQQGWHGINVEPMFQRYKLFKKERKRDTNINAAVGLENAIVPFYNTNSALSTLDKKWADSSNLSYIIDRIMVFRLDEILLRYVPDGQSIDLLSIDTEGHDLEVLMSNDWNKYVPKVIIIETAENKTKINYFLKSKGYSPKYNTCLNTIYVRRKNA